MGLRFHPLLTHPDSPALGAGAQSCAEKELVDAYLQSLPAVLRAQESYTLMADCGKSIRVSPGHTRWKLAVLEKFLLWSFIGVAKPLTEITNKDVQSFLDFCISPPNSWMSKLTNRFVKKDSVLKANPKWHPFHTPLRSDGVRRVINRFFELNSESIGLVHCSRRHPKTLRDDTCRCNETEFMCDQYLGKFKQKTNGKAGLELGLFLFATSFYLKIPLKECVDCLTMDCFDFSDRNNARFKVIMPQGSILGEVPEAYLEYFFRWRNISKLPPYPSSDEVHPLFHRRAINYSSAYIPRFDTDGLSPTRLLKLSQKGCVRCRDSSGQVQVDSKGRRKKHLIRLTNKQLSFSAIDHFYQRSLNNELDASAMPVPLYLVKKNAIKPLPKNVIIFLLALFNPAICKELCTEGASLFCSLVDTRPNHLKLRAFEKLTLWSVLVAGKNPADLDASDVESFYQHCLSPPARWASARIYSRSCILWRPYLILRPGKDNNVPRAGMIVSWCNSCFVDLVQAGVLRSNPFGRLNKYIN